MRTNELEKFHHTVGILVKAYLNDTLKHMDCAACAVGNIIADSLGCKIITADEAGWQLRGDQNYWARGGVTLEPVWQRLFYTPRPEGKQWKWPKRYNGYIKKQIESTGYTWMELARIEKAFESVPVPYRNEIQLHFNIDHDKWMFNGLMSVVDVLADIHKVNLSIKEEAKALFVKS